MPEGYDKYVSFIATEADPIKHLVVDVSSTPPDMLEKLRDYDRQHFEYDGERVFEFIED
jgi:hypothetical protein